MAYKFESLPQLVDHRKSIPRKAPYGKRSTPLNKLIRVWHHSLTPKYAKGSTAVAFANYHIGLWGKSVGYTFIIEPLNVINTPKGKRARIVYANNVEDLTYHVGNSNNIGIGICVTGDYRTETLDDATKATIDELQAALVADGIGYTDKSHQEMPGYSWKACCVFNYMEVFKFLDSKPIQTALPGYYTIQQGDTLWGIANNDSRFTVEDIIKWNPGIEPAKLKVGDKIRLQPPAKKEEMAPSPKILYIAYVKTDRLNVRKGPSVNYPTGAKALYKGDKVSIYEEKNGWCYIGNGQWVSNVNGAYLQKDTPKAVVSTPSKSNGIKSVGKIKIANLKNFTYIYAKPNDTSARVGTANLNEVFDIAGSVPNWYEIIYQGRRCYIKVKYAKKI